MIPPGGDDRARAAFVCQMEQVLDVYARFYNPACPIVCLDETRKQLVSEKRLPFTDSKGAVHLDYGYKREGVATLYMLCEPLGSYRAVRITESQNRLNWARVVAHLVEEIYSEAERITLVQDNLSAHTRKALYEVYPPERARRILQKLHVVWTPVHGAWLNIAELELSVERLFGRTDVIGEVVQNGSVQRQITGVMPDVPETSHVHFDALVSMGTIDPHAQDNWGAWQFFTYAKLKKGTSLEAFTASLDRITERHVLSDIAEETDLAPEQYDYTLFTEPLTGLHLHSEFDYATTGSIATVYTFSAIGLFILLLGCINFMNLATARAAERATEVGVREALGAERSQLMDQLFGEALLTTVAAMVLAGGVASLVQGYSLPSLYFRNGHVTESFPINFRERTGKRSGTRLSQRVCQEASLLAATWFFYL